MGRLQNCCEKEAIVRAFASELCEQDRAATADSTKRVKKSESDQIVKVMREKNLSVTYLFYPNEAIDRQARKYAILLCVVEAFSAMYLGGRYETIGEDFKNSSTTVPFRNRSDPGPDRSSEPN